MFRKLAGVAVLSLLICATAVLAEEVKGSVTKVDDANNKITLKDKDGKETEYTVAKDCKFEKRKGKDGKEADMDLKAIARMVERFEKAKDKDKAREVKIIAVTTKKDGKEVVSEIKMDGEMRKKKDG